MANRLLVKHNLIQISLFSLFCSIFFFSPYRYHKRNSRIELCRVRVYGFQSRLKLKPCFLIGGNHLIRKGILKLATFSLLLIFYIFLFVGFIYWVLYFSFLFCCLPKKYKVLRFLPISIAPALEFIHKCIFDYALPFVHCIHTTHTHTYYINHDFFWPLVYYPENRSL